MAVESGTIEVLVSYTGMPVYQTRVDLCATVDCPVGPGPVTVRYNTTLPGVAPPVRGEPLGGGSGRHQGSVLVSH